MAFSSSSAYPFFRATIALCSGILPSYYYDIRLDYFLYAAALLSICYFGVVYRSSTTFLRKYHYIPGIILFVIFIVFGRLNMTLQKDTNSLNHFQKVCPSATHYSASIVSDPQKTSAAVKTRITVTACQCEGTWKKASGNVLLQLYGGQQTSALAYGDILLIRGMPNTVSAPQNPGHFRYDSYLRSKNIYYIHNISTEDFIVQKGEISNFLVYYTIKIRHLFAAKIKDLLGDSREEAVAEAILLGQKSHLDRSTREAYANTGMMHILAVSGLHVGIIFYMVLLVFNKGTLRGVFKPHLAIISLLIIWFYALLTGLSPSVLRASLMFSLFIIARVFKRHTNIYNIIALTAFILLVYHPLYLLDVGFQLSFIALISIVLIYPFLYQLKTFNSFVGKYLWDLVNVSTAAQMGTFPIALYYFHQFPNYFLIANLLIIPLVFPVVVCGWVFLLSSLLWQGIAHITGSIFANLLAWVNKIIFFIGKIPYASVRDIYIDNLELIGVYAIIIFLVCFLFAYQQIRFFYLASAVFVALLIRSTCYNNITNKQEVFTVYKVRNHSVHSFVKGRCGNIVADSDFWQDTTQYDRLVKPHMFSLGVETVGRLILTDTIPMTLYASVASENSRLVFYDNINILFVTKGFSGTIPKDIQLIVIADNPRLDFNFEDTVNFSADVVLDASNYVVTEEKMLRKFPFIENRLYSVNKYGAYVSKRNK